MNRKLVRIALAAAALMLSSAHADCGKDPECDDLTSWSRFTAVTLKLSDPDLRYSATWLAEFDHERMDILVRTDTKDGRGQPMKGDVAMVGGRIMMSKDLTLEPGYEIDAMDAPILSMKLAMIVLARAYPKGPASISGEKLIDRTDKVAIKYATPSASGYIPAPWRATGKVSKSASGTVAFDLSLTFPALQDPKKQGSQTINMSGSLGTLGRPVFADDASLAGWVTYGVGPQVEKKGGSTILDYGARRDSDLRFKTIQDIRSFIARQDDPGVPDATKDFTGFWKTKCEDAFGLQIKRFGSDGKYSIVFCGPGGCGDPADGRKTFITGDKRFEILSEDVLIEIGRSGDKERHIRCTRDPHPTLRYKQ